jgi:hypothetical protein
LMKYSRNSFHTWYNKWFLPLLVLRVLCCVVLLPHRRGFVPREISPLTPAYSDNP